MKIAVVLAGEWIPGSVDMTEYLKQLNALGHESLMICCDKSEGPADYETHAVDRPTMQDPGFYRNLKIDAAIAFTWFTHPLILTALKQAGVRTLLRADSDGMISFRQFPAHHIRVRMAGEHDIRGRVRAAKHLLQRYLVGYKEEDRCTLGSIEQSDLVVLETQQAANNIFDFLDRQHREDLKSRITVVPHFVADEFLNADLTETRDDTVVAIGRWDDPQKNAGLLSAAIDLHLSQKPSTKFFIIGSERGRAEFASLTRKCPQVTYTGPQNATGVRQHLSRARVLLSASRWEGSPVVANEALAMGCTVVGTPIAAFVDICANTGFGTVARSHAPAALARALRLELQAWDANQRAPIAIAAHWRPLLSSQRIVTTLADLLQHNKPNCDTGLRPVRMTSKVQTV
jgi:glycosyltransferase involved in cell wall biosynthesis